MIRNIKKILLTVAMTSPIIVASPILASCESKPVIEPNLKNAKYNATTNEYEFEGSASAFLEENRKTSNPVDASDPAYDIYQYEKNADGSFKLDKDGKRIIKSDANGMHLFNIENIPQKFKNIFSRLFNFSNLKPRYSFRVFSFTWDELNRYWPSAARKSRYAIYKDRPNVLFFCIYWSNKEHQVEPVFRDAVKEVIAKLVAPGTTYSDEEAPWPFHPGLLDDGTSYLKNISDPIPVVFTEI